MSKRWELVDMTGQTVGGWLVLGRVPNATGNACWLVRHSCAAPQERSYRGGVRVE